MSDDGTWGTDEERDKPLASATGTIPDITEPAAAPSGGGGPHQRTEVGGHRPLRSTEATSPDDVSPPTDDGTWGTDEQRDKPLASATGNIPDITEPAAAPSGAGGPHQRTEVGGHRPLRSTEATSPDDVSPPTEDGTWGTSSGAIGEGEDSPS